jgi:hypothetical protein
MNPKIFNVEADNVDLEFTQGDTIDLSFSVKKNNVVYDMSGMTINMTVRTKVIRTLSSDGTSPAISISTSTLHLVSLGFTESGKYQYDIQVEDLSDEILTIVRGNLIVVKEQTV